MLRNSSKKNSKTHHNSV